MECWWVRRKVMGDVSGEAWVCDAPGFPPGFPTDFTLSLLFSTRKRLKTSNVKNMTTRNKKMNFVNVPYWISVPSNFIYTPHTLHITSTKSIASTFLGTYCKSLCSTQICIDIFLAPHRFLRKYIAWLIIEHATYLRYGYRIHSRTMYHVTHTRTYNIIQNTYNH